jgi:hypothetical protein
MGYRDPNEALRAENESLQQKLKETQEELDGMRARGGAEDHVDRQRFAFGMRCLGGVALMLPFLLMTAMCEHRFMPRHQRVPMTVSATYDPAPAAAPAVNVPRPFVAHACQGRAAPSPGFEGFTRSIERSARVTQAENVPGVTAGTPCTLRVVPVSMQDFNCHVEVVCNGQTLYGALPTGYAHCDVDRSTVLHATDSDTTASDGDGAINVDLTSYRAVITDQVAGVTSRVQLALDAPPSLD